MPCPCETRTSTWRSFATISSGLYRFLAIAVLLDVKDIPQVGPLQWGRITSTSEVLLTPALPFVVPSSEVSLARIWGLGARRVGKFTVVVSIVWPPQSRANDGADFDGQTSLLVGSRSGAERRWIEAARWTE